MKNATNRPRPVMTLTHPCEGSDGLRLTRRALAVAGVAIVGRVTTRDAYFPTVAAGDWNRAVAAMVAVGFTVKRGRFEAPTRPGRVLAALTA